MKKQHFDVICIGGGSGGIAAGVQAARFGKKVAIVEKRELGGTCVNRGCVPKKAMYYGAHIADMLKHDATGYGFDIDVNHFDWMTLKQKRDGYIANIHKFYDKLFDAQSITHFNAWGSFKDNHTISLDDGREISADYIYVCPGARAIIPEKIVGHELGITSDDFFELESQPKKAVVVGGGYIGVEIAQVFHALGTDTTLLIRREAPLMDFDQLIKDTLMKSFEMQQLDARTKTQISHIEKKEHHKLAIHLDNGDTINDVDCLIWATGRVPNTQYLGLQNTDITVNANGTIAVDVYQQTSIDHIYALGDVTDSPQLTPVAIAAGRRLSRRLFNREENLKLDMTYVPTVVFSHPPIGTVGLSEKQAIAKYGQNQIKIYTSNFTALYAAISGFRLPTAMKLVVKGDNEQVIGCHMIGHNVDEILQGFAVAINMGATKADFD
ncbi:MAG: glutathione-disulfide reductase, partial [Francisellaceae bacterium]